MTTNRRLTRLLSAYRWTAAYVTVCVTVLVVLLVAAPAVGVVTCLASR